MSDLDVTDNLRRKLASLNNEEVPIADTIALKHELKEDLRLKLTFCGSVPLRVVPIVVEQISIYAELQLSVSYRQANKLYLM
jgi:hypothetical protein